MGKAPFVAIRTDIRKEERVGVIADIAGYNRHEALGRLVELWSWCTDRVLDDAPTDCDGYAVSDAVVRRFLGPRGVDAILGDGCDALALGERRHDDLIYLRGTSETVSRLRERGRTAGAGGVARAAIGRRESGRFVAKDTIDQRPAGEPLVNRWCDDQPEASRKPAATSEHPQATEEKRESRDEDAPLLPFPKPPTRAEQIAELAVSEINQLSGGRFEATTKNTVSMCKALAKQRRTDEEILIVIHSKRDWIGDPKMHKNFCPSTLLGPENFDKYLDQARGAAPLRAGPARVIITSASEEPDLSNAGLGLATS